MGHHIDDQGRFQSDKYPDLPPDKVVVSFKDSHALPALMALARGYIQTDPEFAADILERLVVMMCETTTDDINAATGTADDQDFA